MKRSKLLALVLPAVACGFVVASPVTASAASVTAGPWMTGKGKLRASVGYVHWIATRRFVGAGNQVQRPNGTLPSPGVSTRLGTDTDGAELTLQAWAISASLGVLDDLDLTLYLPLLRVAFRDDANQDGFDNIGLGDPVFGVAYRMIENLAVSADIKIPVSSVPRTSTDLPISEGQVDLTLWQRSGLGFGGEDWSGWVSLDLGYRIRFAFSEELPPAQGGNRAFKPGNEFLVQFGAGVRPFVDWLAIMVGVEMLFGASGEDQSDPAGLVLQLPGREIIELQPKLLFEPGWGFGLEVAAGIPLYGKSYPAGPRFFTSVSRAFEIW